ncbi:MAG: peptidoglycan-binding protein [Betaproteobacteria bacterium]|nr:MAG: peptidoglycan-binding protein [Betaproteobacteria bacterium]
MSRILTLGLTAAALALVGCEATAPKMGTDSAKTTATGSAGGAGAQNVNAKLGRCDRPAGTIALVEDTSLDWYRAYLDKYRLGSTTPVLRLLIQQSNCFIVVERGRAMANMQQERALQSSGEMRQNSNFGKGQMVAADYSLTPEVLISARGTSGLGAGLAGMGGRLGVLGAIAGGIQTNESAVMLTLVDNRSGVQVAAAEGSSSNTDFSLGAILVGSSGVGGAGGYTNTPQGKVVAAAFTDAYNNIINAVKNYTPQTMGDRGMGTGGRLTVDGGSQQQGASIASSQAAGPAAANASMSMRDAQAKLNQLGYNVGTPDGQMGRKTVEQLRAFQRDRRISTTGQLDQATMNELAK